MATSSIVRTPLRTPEGASSSSSKEASDSFKGEVDTFNDLPLVGNTVGDVYFTKNGQGVWGINRKPSDYYIWTGTEWRGQYNKLTSVTGLTFNGPEQVLSAATGAIIQSALDAKVAGPASSVNDRIATFSGVTGKLIKDSGIAITSLINNLQEAYQGGNTISVDNANGAVSIDNAGVGVTTPMFRLAPNSTFPTTNLLGGSFHTISSDGLLYQYDLIRSKWLCVSREFLSWTDNGNNDNNYLREGNIISTTSGWPVPFDCTIVQIIANGENNLTKGFELRSNAGGAFANIQAFSLSSGFFNNENLNIDVDQGVELKCFATGVGAPVNDPRVTVYIRKRGV